MGNFSEFYELLNISKDSSSEEIRRAYKSLAMKWHPDKHPFSSKSEAEAKFKAISQAYEALKDEKHKIMPKIHRNTLNSLYSSAAKRKAPPVERKLECTLEELFWGCNKEVKFTRYVVTKTGLMFQKTEHHTIMVMPGWRKGTRVTFESTIVDHVFVISEKYHPLFKRYGDDLILTLKIPLVNALAGWSFSFRLLSGEMISCSFRDEIIFPTLEKVIKAEGMPSPNKIGVRGDLRIKFEVDFPRYLSEGQKMSLVELLTDVS